MMSLSLAEWKFTLSHDKMSRNSVSMEENPEIRNQNSEFRDSGDFVPFRRLRMGRYEFSSWDSVKSFGVERICYKASFMPESVKSAMQLYDRA